jgi:hypothetical protein
MPMVALNLALFFVFDFPLLNLGVRDRNHPRCKALESLERRFCWLLRHNAEFNTSREV